MKQYIEYLESEKRVDQIQTTLKDTEAIVAQCTKYHFECLSFYKDIVTINRDNDGKTLKIKLDKYLSNEGSKLNLNVLKKDNFESKLKHI